MNSFLLALGFLTRLGPCKMVDSQEFARCVVFFPIVGLVLGLAVTFPFNFLDIGRYFEVQGWLLVAMNFFLTRGLHWDGWADLWDGWGSMAQGDKFWQIVKDSRLGAFGAAGLIIGLALQSRLFAHVLELQFWSGLVYSFVLGRTAALALVLIVPKSLFRGGLGRMFTGSQRHLLGGLVIGLGLGFILLKLEVLAWSLGFVAVGLVSLVVLARRQSGLNGDFLGMAIIWGELSTLLALVFI